MKLNSTTNCQSERYLQLIYNFAVLFLLYSKKTRSAQIYLFSQQAAGANKTSGYFAPRWGVLPCMGYIGICCCEGYSFQAVYFNKGYINQSVWVQNWVSFFTKLTTWLKILSRLRKLVDFIFLCFEQQPGIATQKHKKKKSASLNFHNSASTLLIDDFHKTLLDIFIRIQMESVVLINTG